MTKLAIYKRVSTDSQDTAAQDHAIREWLAKRNIARTDTITFEDKGISGKTEDRPQYQALLAAIEAGQIKSVVVYRLDRLSRNSLSAMRTLLDWMQRDVEFFAVDQPILQLGRENPLRLTICALFSEIAQLERDAIVNRVRSGLAAAKARGVKLGPPVKVTDGDRIRARELIAAGQSKRYAAKKLGLSEATIRRMLK
jgi:DNA invertase Pin-like site-specific DNA recombinase